MGESQSDSSFAGDSCRTMEVLTKPLYPAGDWFMVRATARADLPPGSTPGRGSDHVQVVRTQGRRSVPENGQVH